MRHHQVPYTDRVNQRTSVLHLGDDDFIGTVHERFDDGFDQLSDFHPLLLSSALRPEIIIAATPKSLVAE